MNLISIRDNGCINSLQNCDVFTLRLRLRQTCYNPQNGFCSQPSN